MAACSELHISHSQFLGGPHRWNELDRAKHLAWRRSQNAKCPNCGTTDRQWKDDPEAFTWQIETCQGCARMADGQDAISESKQKGLMVTLIPPDQARIDEEPDR